VGTCACRRRRRHRRLCLSCRASVPGKISRIGARGALLDSYRPIDAASPSAGRALPVELASSRPVRPIGACLVNLVLTRTAGRGQPYVRMLFSGA
jgi:hypothetical protein